MHDFNIEGHMPGFLPKPDFIIPNAMSEEHPGRHEEVNDQFDIESISDFPPPPAHLLYTSVTKPASITMQPLPEPPHNFHSSACSICSDASGFSFDMSTVRSNTVSTVRSKLRDGNMYSNMEALVRVSGRFESSPDCRVENWLASQPKRTSSVKSVGAIYANLFQKDTTSTKCPPRPFRSKSAPKRTRRDYDANTK